MVATGAKSLIASYGVGAKLGTMICEVSIDRRVWPSGGDLTRISEPMMVLPPGRASTMMGWPQLSVSFGPTIRASRSVVPPGAYGLMMRIGLLGYCCAPAAVAMHSSATAVISRLGA